MLFGDQSVDLDELMNTIRCDLVRKASLLRMVVT